jgi:RNA polymerase sigma factor (sigma-70 family)
MTMNSTDAELLAARDESGEAFACFYRRHVDAVLRTFARQGLSAAEAADLTAETFAAALLSRHRYRPEAGPARAWLLGIAKHKHADSVRRRVRDRRTQDRLVWEPIELTERDLADYDGLAVEALAELPEGQRAAVHSRVVEGEAYASIARRLGLTETAARRRVSRGLAVLRARLKEQQR